jgi:hypothetical protein
MEGHIITIRVRSKDTPSAGYFDSFWTKETDLQQVKYLYHKYTNENHKNVDGAEGSHTLHYGDDYPQVQRIEEIEPASEERLENHKSEGHLPLDFI